MSTRTVPLEPDSAARVNGSTVTTTLRDRPDFAAQTAGKATFAMVGAFAMIAAGNQLVEENDIQDPAHEIADALAVRLSREYGAVVSPNGGRRVDGASVEEIADTYSSADIVVDVQTTNWNYIYFPANWARYRVIYAAKLRLVDTRSQQLLAEGFCSRVPEYTDDAPTHEELVENGAAGLKQELAVAAEYCIDHFRSTVLDPKG
ncbi:MAG: hypothetical protein NXI30_02610 [bacterium]|nr:hypothetical protein [bacterium]